MKYSMRARLARRAYVRKVRTSTACTNVYADHRTIAEVLVRHPLPIHTDVSIAPMSNNALCLRPALIGIAEIVTVVVMVIW